MYSVGNLAGSRISLYLVHHVLQSIAPVQELMLTTTLRNQTMLTNNVVPLGFSKGDAASIEVSLIKWEVKTCRVYAVVCAKSSSKSSIEVIAKAVTTPVNKAAFLSSENDVLRVHGRQLT